MGKLDYFVIVLQRPDDQAIYFPGEPLVGTLVFKSLERFKINAVRMVIDGTCRVKWHEGSGKNRRTYSSKESYLRETIVFMEHDPYSSRDLYLEPGTHTFPFSFTLPLNLPTSFEHKTGRIRYSLNGTIDIPWAIDKHTSRLFSIVNHLDLNVFPGNLRRPGEVRDVKTFCCGPCISAPIIGELTVNKTGFVPGEIIRGNVSVYNNSRYILKPTKVALIQQIDFHGDGFTHHIKKERREVTTAQYTSQQEARSIQEWDDIRLLIPPVCSSTTEFNSYSNLIKISYGVVLFIEAEDFFHYAKEIFIPIVIGTRPLIDHSQPVTQSAYVGFTDNSQSATPGPTSPPPYSYQASCFATDTSEDLPPDYEEAVGNGELLQSNSSTFRPFYPYFGGLSTTL